ncbi:Bax inhibitor-1/YccA family protein [Luedemannella flava]|uniref:Bax inhibitor-1/YccA family protein n=1 Tax=Luedemannella flava TaxID=349316 RepID=A0ABN2LPQ3_9ACTN
MRSSNPVLTRLTPVQPTSGYGAPGDPSRVPYPQPAYPPVVQAPADRMTIDDVVVRTIALLAVLGIAGAAAWVMVPDGLVGLGIMGAAIVGLVIGLVIAFARVTNPVVIFAYALVQGVFVGLISKVYETAYAGIVVQAVAGTFGVFLFMAVLYKFRVIRATPRFTRGLIGAMAGVFVVMLVNWILSLFNIHTGLRGDAEGNAGWIAIGFSLVVIVVAALSFILDFDQIEEAIRVGAPAKMAWTCAFGLVVGLIWVYLEILRLIGYLRER